MWHHTVIQRSLKPVRATGADHRSRQRLLRNQADRPHNHCITSSPVKTPSTTSSSRASKLITARVVSPAPQGQRNKHSNSNSSLQHASHLINPRRVEQRHAGLQCLYHHPHNNASHTGSHDTVGCSQTPHHAPTYTRATTGSTNPPRNPPSRSWPGSSPPLPLGRSCRRRRSCPCSPALAQTRQGPGSRVDAGESMAWRTCHGNNNPQ